MPQSEMQKYWTYTYWLQIVAMISMFLAMPLQWHTEHGTGLSLMQKAIDTTIQFGLDPWNPDEIPVSQWWIVWIIPLIGLTFGLRATNGLIFKQLRGQRILVSLLIFVITVATLWYIATFSEDLLIGFWAEILSLVLLIIALFVEMTLPDYTPEEYHLRRLAPDHPDRLTEGYYRVCMTCGEFNDFDHKVCHSCGATLPID